jgi:hypothetical protein
VLSLGISLEVDEFGHGESQHNSQGFERQVTLVLVNDLDYVDVCCLVKNPSWTKLFFAE